jgi:hypothetical protein
VIDLCVSMAARTNNLPFWVVAVGRAESAQARSSFPRSTKPYAIAQARPATAH